MAKKEGVAATQFITPKGHIRDRIIFHQNAEVPKQGQFLSLNGYAFQVKPGEEIDLPRPVRQMIDTLVITEVVQGTDANGNSEQYTRNRPRFTYTLIAEDVEHPDSPTHKEVLQEATA